MIRTIKIEKIVRDFDHSVIDDTPQDIEIDTSKIVYVKRYEANLFGVYLINNHELHVTNEELKKLII